MKDAPAIYRHNRIVNHFSFKKIAFFCFPDDDSVNDYEQNRDDIERDAGNSHPANIAVREHGVRAARNRL